MYTISSEKKVFNVKIYGSGLNKIRITLLPIPLNKLFQSPGFLKKLKMQIKVHNC